MSAEPAPAPAPQPASRVTVPAEVPPAPAAPKPEGVRAATSTTRRRMSLRGLGEGILLSNSILFTLALASVLIVLHALVAKLPLTLNTELASARQELAVTEEESAQAIGFDVMDSTVLSNQVRRAEQFLFQRREDLVATFSELRRMAAKLGLVAEIAPQPAPEPLKSIPLVDVHSAVIRLELPRSTPANRPVAYSEWLAFLRSFDDMTNKVEVVGLTAAGSGRAPGGALQLEVLFWIRKKDVPTPK